MSWSHRIIDRATLVDALRDCEAKTAHGPLGTGMAVPRFGPVGHGGYECVLVLRFPRSDAVDVHLRAVISDLHSHHGLESSQCITCLGWWQNIWASGGLVFPALISSGL